MTEVEVEKFEITDYDLENEFNPNRRRFRLTKNQQIYGVFAPDDGSDDDDRPTRRQKDYTAPISFVGGGVQKDGKKVEKKENTDFVDLISSDDDEPGPSVPQPKPVKYKKARPVSGFRGNVPEQDFGKWERYTKGIGMKLLLQQGYKPGKGLGKGLQGISQPIEAKQRKGRGAVGAYGSERTEQQIRQAEAAIDSEDEEEREFKKQLGQWKKTDTEGKKKVKYVYKTVDEVISEGGHQKIKGGLSHLTKVKVIDMTGPEQRVLSGYHAIHNQHSKPLEGDDDQSTKVYQNFALPELAHNLDLLVNMMEQEIVQNNRELQFERDQIVNMEHEKKKLDEVLAYEKNQMKALDKLIHVVESLDKRGKDAENPLNLSEVAKTLQELQDSYFEEYKMYEMSDLAVGAVVPLLKKFFEPWKPLQQSSFGLDEMKKWKDLLDTNGPQSYSGEKMEPYDQVVWEVWMPKMRAVILTWDSRDCHPLIELLENWMPLLPPWILQNLLDQVVLPRLQKEVDDWNPLTDNIPIDAWIHPWLALMGTRLEVLYPTIRHKLSNGLANWHPSDCSAKRILEPWKNVFSRATMDAFIIKNVLPKLVVLMQEFNINPHQQLLDPWQWLMDWEDMIPVPSIVTLLEQHFFPKWLQVLCAWLGHNPNYDEVTKWYMGWKSMFPAAVLAHTSIKELFNRALAVMNNAVSMPQGMAYQPGAREHVAYLASLERQREMENAAAMAQPNRDYEILAQSMQNPTATLSMSFKELVERRAMESGLVFIPVPNRFQEAKQVYRFGRLLIYIDRSVIFVQREHTWIPLALQALVEMAQ